LSAAKAEEPIIAATETAATTLLKPCIGFPRYLWGDTCPKPLAKSTSLSHFLFDCCQKALPHSPGLFLPQFGPSKRSVCSGPFRHVALAKGRHPAANLTDAYRFAAHREPVKALS
jgi:hypothetical protein